MIRWMVVVFLALSLLASCAAPAPSPGPGTPTAATAVASPTRIGGEVGYLEGRASIGPLQPVQQVGEPEPTPSAEVCTARGLTIFQADGRTEVTSLNLQPDCTYRVALRPGTYVVALKPLGIDISKDLPQTVVIESGKTTRLDVDIDTGIR